jgi:hypothetical protein
LGVVAPGCGSRSCKRQVYEKHRCPCGVLGAGAGTAIE